MNAYMIYSRHAGPEEGAGLVFAHSVKEAKKVGWKQIGSDFTDDYLDLAVKIIRHSSWLFFDANPKLLSSDIPHSIDNPRSCMECGQWGQSPIGEDDLCEECRDIEEAPDDEEEE